MPSMVDAVRLHRDSGLAGRAGPVSAYSPNVLAMTATLMPQRGGGHHWARYVWDMDGSFTGTEPPAVLASASDNYHGSGEQAEPTIAVALVREAGAWRAEILVNHVGHLATQVTLHALAFGPGEQDTVNR